MELVYLWVEEYKNIRNQGFNFSPRFECIFDGKNLTINENQNYQSIFPKNINVTAIVGKNGSGKTSILEFISNKHETYYKNPILFFAVYLKGTTFYISNDNKKENINVETISFSSIDEYTIIQSSKYQEDFFNKVTSVYFTESLSGSFTNLKNRDPGSNTPYSKNISTPSILNNETQSRQVEENFGDYSKTGFQQVFQAYELNNKLFTLNLFQSDWKSDIILPNYLFIDNINFRPSLNKIDSQLSKDLLKITPFPKKNIDKETFIKDLETNLIIALMMNIKDIGPERYEEKVKIQDLLNEFHDQDLQVKIKRIFSTYYFKFNSDKYAVLDEIEEFFRSFKSIVTKYFKEDKLILETKNSELDFLKKYKELTYFCEHFLDLKWDREYSSGESTMLYQLARFKYYFTVYSNKNTPLYISRESDIILLIDEGELSLHPSWQKKYIKELLSFFEKLFLKKNINVHIIFATHSPFLLSDLPKENIIFLDKFEEKEKEKFQIEYPEIDFSKQKDGDCINVSKHIDIKPFGSNIHTLLSHGFFLDDSLMGEFAKEKIEEVITLLKNDEISAEQKEYCQKIINIIGEPLLQKTLQDMLDKKLNQGKTELEILKEQERNIQKQIRDLESKK